MDRNELAARFAVADYGAKCRAYYAGGPKGPGPDVYSGTAEDAFKMADLFLDYAERIDARPAKSTLTPAPVPPPAGKYVPAVGDFVTWGSCTAMWRVLRVDSGGVYAVFAEKRNYTSEPRYLDPRECETLRLATPSELAAAGLAVPPPATASEVLTPDVPEGSTIAQLAAEQRVSMGATQHFKHDATPAPEAKRPTLADVERSAEAFAHHKGDIPHSPSDAWMDGWLARDRAVAHDGIAHSTNAPCPPPVEGSGEKSVDAGLLEECADALAALLGETEELSRSTFPTREWARAAVRNAYRAIGREVKS